MGIPGDVGPGAATSQAGGRILPPFVFLGALIVMGALHQLAPGPELVPAPWNHLGWMGLAFGIAMALTVDRTFKRAGTTIKPFETSAVLVTRGPFAISRNPIYLGMVVGLIGITVVLGTPAPLVVIPVFVWFIRRRFIDTEERMLEAAFGDDYRAYKRRVRRWI